MSEPLQQLRLPQPAGMQAGVGFLSRGVKCAPMLHGLRVRQARPLVMAAAQVGCEKLAGHGGCHC